MIMTHGSLFAGIGGIDLGFQRAGIETVWAVEIDPYCQKVLRKNFTETEIFGDIKEVGKHNLKSVDIVSAGWPCQPVSNHGKRKGSKDARWLWPEVLRIIKETKPSIFVGENVYGIISLGLDDVLVDLASIGYSTWVCDIPACSVGLPTLERHVWIIATPNGIRLEGNFTKTNQEKPRADTISNCHKGGRERRIVRQTRFCRVRQRVSRKLDTNQKERLNALGNAVPPQMAEVIGMMLMNLHQRVT